MSIPEGFCNCGCGEKTRLAPRTITSHGWIKGRPLRFIRSHKPRKYRPFPPGVIVDPQDQWLAEKYTWRIHSAPTKKPEHAPHLYVVANTLASEGRTHIIRLHRLIMNAPDDMQVDHISGNTLDNRRCNLRIVSRSENIQNRTHLCQTNTSGYRGVAWDSQRKRWRAYARVSGKRNDIGRFANLHDAAKAAYEWRLVNMPGFIPETDPFYLEAA